MEPADQQIAVVGAGLAGCMVALMLARRTDGGRQYNVHVYESRADFRERELAMDATECVSAQ